ncbi:MAG: M48 family metallopeptidase, partial [Magnetococcales bacterium]|nr:M48 family metallopeptidase [Magnetococcales bacterium]
MFIPDWNHPALFFLALVLGGQLLESLALLLDSHNLRKPLPAEMVQWLDAGGWEKTCAYTRARHRLTLLESWLGLLLLVVFWFAGGFNGLNRWVMDWQLGSLFSGVLYIGLLMGALYVVGLPFTLYGTFAIEERFGFNRTTWKTFVADQFKMLLLAVLLGGGILAAILVAFERAGEWAWLYGWVGLTLFSLVLQWVIPRWILPLFNRFSPLADGEPRRAILAYTHSIQFPVGHIFEMDGSRRSSKANAFVSGFGNNRRIALFDTLIQQHTVPELVAVLAHEVGHSRRWHLPKMLLLGVVHTGILFYLLSFFLAWSGLYQGFFMEGMPIYAGLLFFSIVIGPIDLLVGPFFKALSRRFEYEADRFAVETAPEPGALITALKALARENAAHLMPHPFYVFLHHSHPPLLERVAAMEAQLSFVNDCRGPGTVTVPGGVQG